MKIKYNDWRGNEREAVVSEYVSSSIQAKADMGYSGGIAELALELARQNAKAIGVLVGILAEKNRLTREEVHEIAGD